MIFIATIGEATERVEITGGDGRYRVVVGQRTFEVDARVTAQGIYSLVVDGASWVADVTREDGTTLVEVGGETYVVQMEEQTRYVIRTHGGAGGAGGRQTIKAPMPGKVTDVAVGEGQEIQAGQTLIVIEAMKMENEVKARAPGRVKEVRVAPGQTVNPGDVLLVIE